MTEIRVVWQALQRMIPQAMRRPDLLQKYVRLHKQQSLRATRNGYTVEITGEVWVRLPSKKRPNPKPQVMNITIETNGLELTSEVNIDLVTMVRQDNAQELLKAMFLALLISLGIFNDANKRQAFERAMNL